MKDEELAIELLKIKQVHETYGTDDEIYRSFEYYLNKLENIHIDNKIAKIKRVFKDNEGKPGAWTGLNATNMLDKIKRIIENKDY